MSLHDRITLVNDVLRPFQPSGRNGWWITSFLAVLTLHIGIIYLLFHTSFEIKQDSPQILTIELVSITNDLASPDIHQENFETKINEKKDELTENIESQNFLDRLADRADTLNTTNTENSAKPIDTAIADGLVRSVDMPALTAPITTVTVPKAEKNLAAEIPQERVKKETPRPTRKPQHEKILNSSTEKIQEKKIPQVNQASIPAAAPISEEKKVLDLSSKSIFSPKPPYPKDAFNARQEGQVTLKVEVLTTGAVGQVIIEKSSSIESMDQSALETVKKWQYSPAIKDAQITAQWIRVTIKFQLKKAS